MSHHHRPPFLLPLHLLVTPRYRFL
jgi:hypothetical protein